MATAATLPHDAGSREGQRLLERAFGDGAASALQILVHARDAAAARSALERDRDVAAVGPAERSRGQVLITAIPDVTSGHAGLNATIDRIRGELPAGALLGGPAAETRDLERALVSRLPVVVGVALGLGFLLLIALVRAPLLAAAAVAMSVVATAAAFGVARLVFQDGVLDSLLGWRAQGFVDAWAPIFFFALIFALAMDYTVFLLATVKAVHDRTGDGRRALVEGLAGTGRVINAAAGVMVVVFLTFAHSGAIAPREMGVILAVAVLLDATLIRLLLMPVVLRLLGARAWWMPAWLERLVPNVEMAHGQAAPEPAPG
jgi:RND superfamily putative drug exporter